MERISVETVNMFSWIFSWNYNSNMKHWVWMSSADILPRNTKKIKLHDYIVALYICRNCFIFHELSKVFHCSCLCFTFQPRSDTTYQVGRRGLLQRTVPPAAGFSARAQSNWVWACGVEGGGGDKEIVFPGSRTVAQFPCGRDSGS
jgi:hypothetical protein